MTSDELFEWCCNHDCSAYSNCDLCMYDKGKTDILDEVIKALEVEFLIQNNPKSKFVETIVLHRDFIEALENLKEQSHGTNDNKS